MCLSDQEKEWYLSRLWTRYGNIHYIITMVYLYDQYSTDELIDLLKDKSVRVGDVVQSLNGTVNALILSKNNYIQKESITSNILNVIILDTITSIFEILQEFSSKLRKTGDFQNQSWFRPVKIIRNASNHDKK